MFNGEDEDDADDDADEDDETGEEEALEEIDFADIGRLQAEVDASARTAQAKAGDITVVEEKFTGFHIDPNSAILQPPSRTVRASQAAETALGDIDDEVIVYVAPHPRAGPVTPPLPEPVQHIAPYTSILTGQVGSAEDVKPCEESVPIESTDEPLFFEDTIGQAPTDEVQHASEEVAHLTEPTVAPLAAEIKGEDNAIETAEPVAPSVVAPTAIELSETHLSHVKMDTSETVKTTITAETAELHVPVVAQAETSANTSIEVSTATPIAPAFEQVSFSFSNKPTQPKKIARKLHPVRTPKALRRPQPRRKSIRHFGVFGAQLEEAHLHEVDDPRRNERRRGDSDLDWGSGSDDDEEARIEDAVEELSNGVGGMEIDEGLNERAMASFVQSMSAKGAQHVTMDDLDDAEMLKREDEEGSVESSGSEDEDEEEDSELEAAVRQEEDVFVASAEIVVDGQDASEEVHSAGDDEEDVDDLSSDEEETPRRGFQARLEKIRKSAAKGKGRAQPLEDSNSDDEDGEDEDMSPDGTRAESDEDFIDEIQVSISHSYKNRVLIVFRPSWMLTQTSWRVETVSRRSTCSSLSTTVISISTIMSSSSPLLRVSIGIPYR